jgi:DNA-binding transcriptional MerR regulator
MEYRVEALAAAASVGVDTVRFYQARGLLPAPARVGRVALYGDDHLARLRRIRALQGRGFSLAQIQRVLTRPTLQTEEPLLAALLEERVGERTVTRAELAAEAGVPEVLVRAAESAGLVAPLLVDGEERSREADLEMARAGLAILEAGFPMQALLERAVIHARNVQEVCDAAIDLFDEHIRKRGSAADDPEAITRVFQELLPQITRLVALHFQRTLVSRALTRLQDKHRLEVEVAWR